MLLKRKQYTENELSFHSAPTYFTHTLRKNGIYDAGQEEILLPICFLRKYDIICDIIIRLSRISFSILFYSMQNEDYPRFMAVHKFSVFVRLIFNQVS